MTFLCDNPWIFHRDEIDLLEEEMDELYRRHDQKTEDGSISDMEDQVLSEQLETEEAAEAELSIEIGPEYLLPHPPHHTHEQIEDEESLLKSLQAHGYRDPVYARIYSWAIRAFLYSTKRYVKESVREKDVFRVYVNAKMIPIKFVASQTERFSDDAESDLIAEMQRSLCLIYFERTLEPLARRSVLGDEEATLLLQEGRDLEELARSQLV